MNLMGISLTMPEGVLIEFLIFLSSNSSALPSRNMAPAFRKLLARPVIYEDMLYSTHYRRSPSATGWANFGRINHSLPYVK